MGQACFVCGVAGPDVRPVFFRVVGATYAVVAARVRWLNFRCPCCDECFDRGAAISRDRQRVVSLWVLAPFVIIPVVAAILHFLFRVRGAPAGAAAVVGLLWLAGFFLVLPLSVARMSRRRIPEFLGPDRDDQLRRLTGVRKWGVSNHLVVLRKLPKREGFVDLCAPDLADEPERGASGREGVTRRPFPRWVIAAGLLLLAAAVPAYLYFHLDWAFFEESEREVRARYASQLAEKRGQLKRLAAALPPPGQTPETVGPVPLDPPLETFSSGRPANFTGAMASECLDPGERLRRHWNDPTRFWVSFPGGPDDLVSLIDRLQGDREPPAGVLRKRGEYTARRCEEVLSKPYLVVCRVVDYEEPAAAAAGGWAPGRVDLEAFLFDLRDDSRLACLRARVRNAGGRPEAVAPQGGGGGAQRLRSELQELAHGEIERKLRALRTVPRPRG